MTIDKIIALFFLALAWILIVPLFLWSRYGTYKAALEIWAGFSFAMAMIWLVVLGIIFCLQVLFT